MNTLTLSHLLKNTGLTTEQSEVIAQAIDEKNKEMVTESHFDQSIKGVREFMYFSLGLMSAGIAYLATLTHSIIDKL